MTKDKRVGKHPKIEEQKGSFNPFDKYPDGKTSSNEDFKKKEICYGFNKNHRQNYIPDNLAITFHIVALQNTCRCGKPGRPCSSLFSPKRPHQGEFAWRHIQRHIQRT
jgi:hypothetical protein